MEICSTPTTAPIKTINVHNVRRQVINMDSVSVLKSKYVKGITVNNAVVADRKYVKVKISNKPFTFSLTGVAICRSFPRINGESWVNPH